MSLAMEIVLIAAITGLAVWGSGAWVRYYKSKNQSKNK